MQRTIFDTPVLSPILRSLSAAGLALFRWRLEGDFPDERKYVLVGAPHTSNWDFVLLMCFALYKRKKLSWMGKHTLFLWPFGYLMRWMGGIAVDRGQRNSMVSKMIERVQNVEEIILVITPEGTRSHVLEWKTGFYHIANGTGVPISLTYIDLANRRAGFGPLFQPAGNLEADISEIQAFYRRFLKRGD